MNVDLIYPGNLMFGPVPFGIISLASILEQPSYSVRVLDFDGQMLNLRSFSKKFGKRKPDIVGITTFTTPMLKRVVKVANYTRRLFPECLIVCGGVHATIFPEQILRELPVDIVVFGEGDLTLPELVKTVESGEDLSRVKGIYYKEGDSIIKTPERSIIKIKDLETSPMPAWHLIDPYRHNYIYLIESRGCPFRCSFCYAYIHKRYRTKSVNRVVEDVKCLYNKHKIRAFKFWDDLPFGGSKSKMTEFCERLLEERLDIRWSCFIRPEMVTHEVLRALERAGCFYVAMGVESGSPRMLKLLNKDTTVEKYLEAFNKLSQYNLITAVAFMLGLPDEEIEDIQMTIKLAKKIGVTVYYPQNFKPYPGTKLYDYCLQKGFKEPKTILEWAEYSDFSKYNVNVSNVDLDTLIKARKQIISFGNPAKYYSILSRVALFQVKRFSVLEAKKFFKLSLNKLWCSLSRIKESRDSWGVK
ncbi:B12-binding domain-containing radical SAM protein [candidate division WOR-3 bacterium]|nr:B12-binding domain-containing radical SAM protein [candidate division WOR-3 bacterium]